MGALPWRSLAGLTAAGYNSHHFAELMGAGYTGAVESTAAFQQSGSKFQGGFAFAPEHTCDFFLSRFTADFMQLRLGPSMRHLLCHHKM